MAPNENSNMQCNEATVGEDEGSILGKIRSLCEVFDLEAADVQFLQKQPSKYIDPSKFLRPVNLLHALGMKWGLEPGNPEFAHKLDKLNNFDFRDQFAMPKKGELPHGYGKSPDGEMQETVYLCSHSLGLKPKLADEYIMELLERWENWGILAHFNGSLAGKLADVTPRPMLEKLVGAKPGETTLLSGLSVNLNLLLVHFYQPTAERYKILIEEHAFPSDMYAVKSHLRFHGICEEEGLVLLKKRQGDFCIREEDIHDVLEREGSRIACVLLPGLQYLSGQRFDIEKITKWGHQKGCIVGWDLAHSVCNVPLKLHDWEVDFATWCSYKYMCGGQGCNGGIFVHENMWGHTGPKFEGWWGTRDQERFKMKSFIEPPSGVDSFRISHPSVWASTTVLAALQVYDQVDWDRFGKKQFWLTGYLECIIKRINADLAEEFPEGSTNNLESPIMIASPEDPQKRGSQLTFMVDGDAQWLCNELTAHGVICDFRYPNCLRVAPSPMYNRYEEVRRFGEVLLDIMRRQDQQK